jgi:tetratricopeptide (TPR) repeat protein
MLGHRRTVATAVLMFVAMGLLAGCQEPNSLLRKRGVEAWDAKDVDRAESQFGRAVEQDSTDWKATWYMGRVRLEQNRPLEAQLLLEKALTLRPDKEQTPYILDDLAESLYQQEEYGQLYSLLSQAAEGSGSWYEHLRKAKYLAKAGDPDGARASFYKAAQYHEPDDNTVYLAMADFYESLNDSPNAILALRRAYTIKPNSPLVANRLRHHGEVPGPTLRLDQDWWDQSPEVANSTEPARSMEAAPTTSEMQEVPATGTTTP